MNVAIKTKRYFTCPSGCDHEFQVEHLFQDLELGRYGCDKVNERGAGPWYCDECGQGWVLRVCRDGQLDVDEFKPADPGRDGKRRPCFVILEIPPQQAPIRLKVRGTYCTKALDLDAEHYLYEEHLCPASYLAEVEQVWLGEDEDPHGLARFVTAYDVEAAK